MKFLADSDVTTSSFWLHHPDPTQAAVHLALQWVAYVYPASEQHLDETLRRSLSYTDDKLIEQWRDLLENQDLEAHVEALRWLSETLSRDQVPFLVESCWRLVLIFHEMPGQVPLALRLMGRVLDVPERRVLEIGQRVQRETQEESGAVDRSPLLPEDPRYLDRIEWRLFGARAAPRRPRGNASGSVRHLAPLLVTFIAGLLVGGGGVSYLVWGPAQLGRQPVPRLSHQALAPQSDEATAQNPAVEALVMEPTASQETASPSAAQSAGESDPPGNDEASGNDDEAAPGNEGESAAAGADNDAAVAAAAEDQGPDTSDADTDQAAAGEPAPEDAGVSEQPGEILAGAPDLETEEVLMTVTASVLNVRAEPSTSAEIVMKLGQGARVWVAPGESVDFWERIRVAGEQGYASGQFLAPVE